MRIIITIDGNASTYSSFGKRKILGLGSTISRRNMGVFEGRAKVDYGQGFTNEFDFVSPQDYRDKLEPCIEDELMDFLGLKHVRASRKSTSREQTTWTT